jgi:hypothetical protein
LLEFSARAIPVRFDVIEERGFVNHRALFRAHERLQVKVPGLSLYDRLFRVQLRQLPPDVISNAVVRFVKRIGYEILYAHKMVA